MHVHRYQQSAATPASLVMPVIRKDILYGGRAGMEAKSTRERLITVFARGTPQLLHCLSSHVNGSAVLAALVFFGIAGIMLYSYV